MSFASIAFVGAIGLTAYGGYQERKGIGIEGEATEAVHRFNAAQSRLEAKRVRKIGAEKEFQIRTDLRERLARNRVATAAAGVMALGSPLDAELLNVRYAARDIAILEETVMMESMKLETLADFQLRQAELTKKATKAKKKGSTFGTIGKILSIF